MLRIQSVVIRLVCELRPLLETISQHDPDLGRQMRRALTSVPLNIAEGSSSRGRNRNARYHTAADSMREVSAAIDVAEAFGYITSAPSELRGEMALVVNTLMKVARQ